MRCGNRSKKKITDVKAVNTYSALALVYDMVMDHVDYDGWADYILHLLDEHSPKEDSPDFHILELGCGTGLFTSELLFQTEAKISAADFSENMLEWAKKRLAEDSERVSLYRLDFESGWDQSELSGPIDAILLLYDCINYIQTEEGLARLFRGVKSRMGPDSIFIFDQSTPANSINNAEFFEDEGEQDGIAYTRKSSFDDESRLHTTQFEITTTEGVFQEQHVQRAWTRQEIWAALERSQMPVLVSYDGFSLDEAHDESERIHWVIGNPPRSSAVGDEPDLKT